jgi:hypothetical protein
VRGCVPEGGQATEEGNEGQEGDGPREDDEVTGKGHVRDATARYLPCTLHARLRDGMPPCSHTATMEER